MGATKTQTKIAVDTEPKKQVKDKATDKNAKKTGKAEKATKAAKRKAKVSKKNVSKAMVYVNSTFNNTLITVTDPKGEVIAWSSGGVIGYKGSRKSTPFAGAQAAKDAMDKAKRLGVREIEVFVKGPGQGKETAVKALASAGMRITTLKDTTAFPHDGCRPKKRRR